MPTRADWEAASPKCPMRVARSGELRVAVGAASSVCYRPLRFDAPKQMWACPDHGCVVHAHLAAAERRAAEFTELSDAA